MLRIFSKENKIITGENTPQFTQLEYLVQSAIDSNNVIPSLGLFGAASVGKTTAVKLIAEKTNNRLILYNAITLDIKTFHENLLKDLGINRPFYETPLETAELDAVNFKWVSYKPPQKTIVFIDEAHALSKELQTLFLTAFDSNRFPYIRTVSVKDITWVFATTDSSKLLYPLITRIFPIVFTQYSKQDIANIISLSYPEISEPVNELFAVCSKFTPRLALRYAELFKKTNSKYTLTEGKTFIKNILGMDESGLDSIDKRILLYLSLCKRKISQIDNLAYDKFTSELNTLSKKVTLTEVNRKRKNELQFKIATLEKVINSPEYLPKSRQDISLGCNLQDLGDLERRLSFLESLNFLKKTPKGILLTPTC